MLDDAGFLEHYHSRRIADTLAHFLEMKILVADGLIPQETQQEGKRDADQQEDATSQRIQER
ncbi:MULTISPECIES: hypothetical protein [unclassified Polaromonas]|uniref:hypothetical protein n=1 Tax=unclassified Polaromonas TaxID=2638319 RepID=UPI0025EDE55B|nr:MULTISPECIES: hypothetical protein [unclassified Polaromonas]HQR98928.1 hypothetical protein [Polaromonas sp.]HQS40666.1 hypothetical protein [Polaromonas sp.]HQS88687.1 hypothetical protein [Polaromonas sp.]HQT08165.1 hypothetical protein [Polaromonas sp.]